MTQRPAEGLRRLVGQDLGEVGPRPVGPDPGTTPAPRHLVLAAALPMVAEVLERHASDGVFHGFNRVRFPAPVLLGERVRCDARLTQIVAVAGALQVGLIATVSIDRTAERALIADCLFRFRS